jgi:Predicted DNA modification methylase
MAAASQRTIPPAILTVLAAGTAEANRFLLPSQLDRKTYALTNKVLEALGGRWDRRAGAHVFDGGDCRERLEDALDTGSYERPDNLGWFPTPPALAKRMVDLVGDVRGKVVLEPSAGDGAIASVLHSRGANVRAVEIEGGRVKALAKLLGANNVAQGDFLAVEPFPVDLVLANPPFARRADIHHLTHALRFLKPGGRLVAIMGAGITFRQDALTTAFRARFASIEPLPEGSFKASGTFVSTVLVTAHG